MKLLMDHRPLPFVWTRLVRPAAVPSLHRAGQLTPYLAQSIEEEAGTAGREARLEITVAGREVDLSPVRERFRSLARRGVAVVVRRARFHGALPSAAA